MAFIVFDCSKRMVSEKLLRSVRSSSEMSLILFNTTEDMVSGVRAVSEKLGLKFIKVQKDVEVTFGTVYAVPRQVEYHFNGIKISVQQKKIQKTDKNSSYSEIKAKYDYMTLTSKELICLHNVDGTFKEVSPSAKKILGYNPEELVGLHPGQLVHKDDLMRVQDAAKMLIYNGIETKDFQYRLRHKNGRYVWLEAYTSCMRDENGKIQFLLSGSRDISDLKYAELELRHSRNRFRGIADNLPGVIYLCKNDANYSMLYLNDEVARLTGYDPYEFVGGSVSFIELYHPDDKERIYEEVEVALIKQEPFRLTYRLKHRTKPGWVWVEEYGQGIYQNGVLEQLEGVILDITERKKAEFKIIEREANLKSIMASTDSMIGFFDRKQRVLMANTALTRYFKEVYDTDILGKFVKDLQFELKDIFMPKLQEALEGKAARFETSLMRGDSEINFLMNLNPVWRNSEVIGASMFVEDVSALKNAQKELQKQNENLEKIVAERTRQLKSKNDSLIESNQELAKAISHLKNTQKRLVQAEKMASLGVLAAGVGHEINNPLNFIQNGVYGMMELLKEEEGYDEERFKPFLGIISDGVSRASNIVKSLSHFSRQVHSKSEACDINDIIDNCLVILNSKLKDKVEVIKDLDESRPVITGNGGRLHQAFLNILANAEQAITKTGTIRILTRKTEESITISFKDDGVGINDEHLNKIADPFFTTKDPGEGTGLGLFITFSIIEELGGTIEVYSKLGEGSEFIISFVATKELG